MKAIEVHFDEGLLENGVYSLFFSLNEEEDPHYVTLCRDLYEDPDRIYFEAGDQGYGFYSDNLCFELNTNKIVFILPDNSSDSLYKNGEKKIEVEFPESEREAVKERIETIFDYGSIVEF